MQRITTKTMSIVLSTAIILCGFNVVFNVFDSAKADIIVDYPEISIVDEHINFEILSGINYDADYVEWWWDFDNNADDYEKVVNSGYGENLHYAVHNYSEADIYKVRVKITDNGDVMTQDLQVVVVPVGTTDILENLYDQTVGNLTTDISNKKSGLFTGKEIDSMELNLKEGLYINDNEEIDLDRFFGEDLSSIIDNFFNSNLPKSDIISDFEQEIGEHIDVEYCVKPAIDRLLARGADFDYYIEQGDITEEEKGKIIEHAEMVEDEINSKPELKNIIDYAAQNSNLFTFEFILVVIIAGCLGGALTILSTPVTLIIGVVTAAVVAVAAMVLACETGDAGTIGGWFTNLFLKGTGISLSSNASIGTGAAIVFVIVLAAFFGLYAASSIIAFLTVSVECMGAIVGIVYFLSSKLVNNGKLSINEVSPNPINGCTWIELYNTMDDALDLDDLTFAINNHDIFTTPCGYIRSGEYILVSFDKTATEVVFDWESSPRNLIIPSDRDINDYDEVAIYLKSSNPEIDDFILDSVTMDVAVKGEKGDETDYKSYSACPNGGDEFKVVDWSPGAENNEEEESSINPVPIPIANRPLLKLILNFIFERNPDAFPILRYLFGF